MSSTQNGRDEDGELHTFEKNRYFHGKLMTARDMLAEQDYHADRLAATNRYVNGQGIVCGLDVDETDGGLREEEGELRVALRPGFALDASGRPVVVTGGTVTVKDSGTNHPGIPSGDIDLYLRFDECDVETVPRPGSENACEEECTYNRILEVFDVVFESDDDRDATVGDGDDGGDAPTVPNGYKPVRTVAFPGPDDVTEQEDGTIPLDDPGLMTIAREYYETHLSECRGGNESWVFLGTFTDPTDDGTWERVAEDARFPHGSLVYTNDMLYAAIARHTADFHNPHQVTLDVRDGDGTPSVHVRDDESDLGDVALTSNDTIDIDGTTRSETGSASIGFAVNLPAVVDAINAVTSVDGVLPNEGGNVDLIQSGGVTITPDTDNHQITIDVPIPVEQVGDATPDDEGRINISGTEGVSVTTSGNEITVEGPGSVAAPDLGPVVESMIRRSITCKYMSYSAALERFLDVLDNNITNPMTAVVTATSRFLGRGTEGEFTREGYAGFIEAIFPAENALNDDISDGQVSAESAERYQIGFTELNGLVPGDGRNADLIDDNGNLTVDDERLLAIIAAQDCLARAVGLLRREDRNE